MFIKVWLLPLLLAVSSFASPSPAPQYPSSPEPPRAGYYPSSSQKPVYTAQRARGESLSRENSREEEDEPYPSTFNLGTAQTTHGAVEDQPENTGFVQPIDFKNLLREVESGSKGLDIGASSSSSNPLFASESKNSFAGFFGSNNNKDPFADFGSGLATASSDRNSKRPESGEDSPGFVDPNVQFRSLFDSSQTANTGFKPEDFLGYKGDASSSEPSKGSQTQAYPSFTYTGRKDEDYGPSSNPKYRSSYRQVESQDDDYNNNPNQYRHRDDREDSEQQDDRGYYNSREEDDDPRGGGGGPSGGYSRDGPPPPPRGYHSSPTPQETSHRPQSTGNKRSSGPKASASSNNPKCKKVEKTVDYQNNDDYASFTEPEADYDPSTYRGRYKRQSSRQGRQSGRGGGGGGGNKRPMTCYVCEDEQGRYAERCSYDSKANPKKGEYFHSSSSAYSDNGRRPSGKSDRIRRNPSGNDNRQQEAEASATSASASIPASPSTSGDGKKPEIEESEPEKVIEKRQSSGDRYANDFGENGNRRQTPNNRRNDDDLEFNTGNNRGGGDYGLPRGYIGNNNGRVDDFGINNNRDSAGAGTGNSGRNNNENNNYGFTGANNNNNNNNRDNFGFDAPSFNDFNNFGSDFGREASPSGGGGGASREFNNFDFSIPKEYDPDVQHPERERGGRGPERQNNPDGSASSDSESFPALRQFETGYDDYVKEYFPEPFGGGERSSGSSTHRPSSSPSYSPSSGPSISSSPGHHQPSYRPRPSYHHGSSSSPSNSFNQHENSPPSRPNYHFNSNNNHNNRGNPEKQHTQPSHNFAPPPNFFNEGGGQAGFENTQSLHNLMDNFDGKERSGCQKIQKGDMSCYVCKDARGMNKEECMYASKDPKNQRMAYHEVTEYSSDPPASVVPLPRPHQHNNNNGNSHHPLGGHHSGPLHQSGSSPVSSSVTHDAEKKVSSSASPSTSTSTSSSSKDDNKPTQPSSGSSVTRVESKVISLKFHEENKSPVEYDFDY